MVEEYQTLDLNPESPLRSGELYNASNRFCTLTMFGDYLGSFLTPLSHYLPIECLYIC